MKNLVEAFNLIPRGDKFTFNATVNHFLYKPNVSERVTVNKLWNGKICLYRNGYDSNAGYVVCENENHFDENVKIDSWEIMDSMRWSNGLDKKCAELLGLND